MSKIDFSQLNFRSICEADVPFLKELYASTRALELSQLTDWSEAQKQAFVEQQFQAQHHHYLSQYQDAQLELILFKQKTLGRLYIDRRPQHIQLMDITLSPQWRNQGIGHYLMRQLIHEAQLKGCTLGLYVEPYNPAFHLYQRLGFVVQETYGAYYRMQWQQATVFDTHPSQLGVTL